MLSSFRIVIYDFFFYLETFCKMWKNSKEIEERICEGVLAIPLEKKTEALLWKLPVELFISRTFPASLCFNCVLKISPEGQSTTCPEACPSDRETKKYRFLGFPEDTYSGFYKNHRLCFRSPSARKWFYRITGFPIPAVNEVPAAKNLPLS